jgi:hypothetical protein
MLKNGWGLLGPEVLPNSRRTRTLGLGAVVRLFNDLAVPGLGGVWYGKQVFLPLLGVAVAERAREMGYKVQNIEVANAIEALACWLAFKKNKWASDARLRGGTKLQVKDDNFHFARVRQRNFYVTQPMRMATVQTLPALGLVKSGSTRFNAFECTDIGWEFIEQACKNYRPYNRKVIDHLVHWVQGEKSEIQGQALLNALSPLEPLSDEMRPLLIERLIQGGDENSEDKQRRSNALAWVEEIRKNQTKNEWETKPDLLSDEHWHDLVAGEKLSKARDAAIAVLDAIEEHVNNKSQSKSHDLKTGIPEMLTKPLSQLKSAAKVFLDTGHVAKDAITFCRECTQNDDSKILYSLLSRDGHVLRLVGDVIQPGKAFRGLKETKSADEDEVVDTPNSQKKTPLPVGVSYRLRNLYLLNLDLHGKLNEWLKPVPDGVQS